MFIALLKKQILELFSVFTLSKDEKDKSKGAGKGVFVVLILLYAFGMMAYSAWEQAGTLCAPLVSQGKDALFFLSSGASALGVAVLLGALISKGMVYDAKDNESLLSMPIPPQTILLARLSAQYIYLFLFTLANFAPAVVRYFMTVGVQPLSLVFCVLLLFLLPILALAISALLGWLAATLTAGLPKKHFLNTALYVLVTVLGILGYTLLTNYTSAMALQGGLTATAETILFPLLQMGKAASGDGLGIMLFLLITAAFAGLTLWLISATFLKIVTTEKGEVKVEYKAAKTQAVGADTALLRKEASRFFKTPIYLLNAGFGTVFMIIAAVLGLVMAFGGFGEEILSFFSGDMGALILAAGLCLLSASIYVSLSSISLEGEGLTLLKALPISSWQVLRAKLLLHILVAGIPALLCAVIIPFAVPVSALNAVLIGLNALACVVATAAIGLSVNLKLPMLEWTSEAVVVKQSMATLMGMLAQTAAVLVPVGVWLLVGQAVSAWVYLLCALAYFALLGVLVVLWLKKQGAKELEAL